jgi:hypothetical protein
MMELMLAEKDIALLVRDVFMKILQMNVFMKTNVILMIVMNIMVVLALLLTVMMMMYVQMIVVNLIRDVYMLNESGIPLINVTTMSAILKLD